jgi:hypothetical protein
VNVIVFHPQSTDSGFIYIRIGLQEYRFIEETDTHLSSVLTCLLQFSIIFAKLGDMTWSFTDIF